MAQIKAKQGHNPKNIHEAVRHFKRVIELNPRDFDANFEIAQLFEQTDPKQALIYYEDGIKIMKEEIESEKPDRFLNQWNSSCEDPSKHLDTARKMVPPELLNNVGVLMMETDRHSEAELSLHEALKNVDKMLDVSTVAASTPADEEPTKDKRLMALRINIRFNQACCLEQAHKIGEATEKFKALIRDEPSYTDAYLRLAYLARARGDSKRALDYVDSARANFKKGYNQPTNLHCIKGSLQQEFGMINESIDEYKKALHYSQNKDTYSRIGLANIHYF